MLERLFHLDHLATRMRREVEGQIALSGGQPSRVFRQPVKLIDAMRAAVAEVEAYTRVEANATVDVSIAGPAVGDVIHLLAELIENACQMSPEQTPVVVTGDPAGTGIAVEVSDRGIGIEPATMADLNRRLADPPPFHPESEADKLGLWVVANLARRHGIRVSLARSPYGGVSAVALLPAEVLAASPAGRPAETPSDDGPLRAALARMDAFDRLDVVGSGYEEPAAHAAAPAGSRDRGQGGRSQTGPLVTAAVRDSFFLPPPVHGRDQDGAGYAPAPAAARLGQTGLPIRPVDAPPAWLPDQQPARPAAAPAEPEPDDWPEDEPRVGHLPRRSRGESLSAELRGGRFAPSSGVAAAGPGSRATGPASGPKVTGPASGPKVTGPASGPKVTGPASGPKVSRPDPEKARRLVTAFRAGYQQGLPTGPPRDDERIGDATHR
jgi:hypothetical protein